MMIYRLRLLQLFCCLCSLPSSQIVKSGLVGLLRVSELENRLGGYSSEKSDIQLEQSTREVYSGYRH